jgi:hypothetical protein
VLLRQGHLSEDELTRAIVDGVRPAHLDRCDICARRGLELGRWLEETRTAAHQAAEEAFPAERLAAQQSQILRRLAQIDEPARVITFPAAVAALSREPGSRRVAPAWVGVAAAAGLVVGIVSGQMAARLESPGRPETSAAVPVAPPAATAPLPQGGQIVPASLPGSFLEMDLEGLTPESLREIDDMTPRIVPSSFTIAQR